MNDTTRTIVAKAIESRREELKGIKEQRTALESSVDFVKTDLDRLTRTLVTVNSTIGTIAGEIEALQEDLRRYDTESRPDHVLTGYNVSKSIQETSEVHTGPMDSAVCSVDGKQCGGSPCALRKNCDYWARTL